MRRRKTDRWKVRRIMREANDRITNRSLVRLLKFAIVELCTKISRIRDKNRLVRSQTGERSAEIVAMTYQIVLETAGTYRAHDNARIINRMKNGLFYWARKAEERRGEEKRGEGGGRGKGRDRGRQRANARGTCRGSDVSNNKHG